MAGTISMYWTDVVSLSGTAASVAVMALWVFLFGWNWYALGAGAAAFVVVCAAIAYALRIADQRDMLKRTHRRSLPRN
jgi:hypothetical protein